MNNRLINESMDPTLMDADALLIWVLVVAGMLLAAALPYFIVEARWRWRWREVEVGREPIHDGDGALYRASGTVPIYLRRAPALVRAAAFTCLLFGQLFVPGLILGAMALVAGGVGLVMIPGLITAAKLYLAGLALLRREPRVAFFRARNAAAWTLWLNGVELALTLVVALLLGPADEGVWYAFAAFNGWSLICAAQALVLLKASRAHEDALFLPTEAVRLGPNLYRTTAPK
jgi:hypothetical protein